MSMIIDPYRFGAATPIGNVPSSNLRLHLESDFGLTLVSSGTKVNEWADQSGNLNKAFQNSSSYQPTYVPSSSLVNNLPGIDFSSPANSSMAVALSPTLNFSSAGFTLYMVLNIQTYTLYGTFMQHSNDSVWSQGWGIIYYNNNLRFWINNWNNVANYVELTAPTVGSRILLKFSWDKTTIKASYRKANVTTAGTKAYAGAYTHPAYSLSIMTPSGGNTTNDISSTLGAILMYNGVLSAQDELDLETYLKSKYGIA